MPDFRSRYFWISVVLVLASLAGGFFAGQFYSAKQAAKPPKEAANSLFVNQEATIRGKITNSDNNTLTVQSNTGQTGSVKLGEQLIINRFDERARPATPSSDPKTIELNRDVTLLLNFVNGEYLVNTITYFPPIPNRPAAPRRSSPAPTPER
jgi:hypothetical protein